jgi:hypothetical protein
MVVTTYRRLWFSCIEFWDEFSVWLLKLDIIDPLNLETGGVGPSRGRNGIIKLECNYMHSEKTQITIQYEYLLVSVAL